MNKIKILLATYNGERYIADQIQTILSQENVDSDLLIQDDNSTDNTINIIKDKFPNINVKQNIPGTGTAAKNFLKMLCNLNFNEDFEYVAFADQDDIWLPNKITNAISCLKKDNASLYCSNLTKWDTSQNSYTTLKKDFPQKKFDYLFEGGSAGCTYVFTKDFAKNLKNFILTVDYSDWKEFSHDWMVYFFARSRNYKVYIDGNSYIHYRIHSNNVHGHLNKLTFKTLKEKSNKVLNGYYQEHVKNYIKYLDQNTIEYKLYKDFLGGYFRRNLTIIRFHTELMRDNKKVLIFTILNLLKFK